MVELHRSKARSLIIGITVQDYYPTEFLLANEVIHCAFLCRFRPQPFVQLFAPVLSSSDLTKKLKQCVLVRRIELVKLLLHHGLYGLVS
jgi:hypothetical protein